MSNNALEATPQERKAREGSSFLAYVDAAGCYADFHALRHTCGSLLAASGCHVKVAQSIMRHSTIDLTMSRYTHVYAGQEADAVSARPERESAKATGTYDDDPPQNARGRPRIDDRLKGETGVGKNQFAQHRGREGATAAASESRSTSATTEPTRVASGAGARLCSETSAQTHDEICAQRFAKSFDKSGALPCISVRCDAQKADTGDSEKTLVNTDDTAYLQGQTATDVHSSAKIERRFPKPQVRGSSPLGRNGESSGERRRQPVSRGA